MMTFNATGATFFGQNPDSASFAFISKFKSMQMNFTISSLSEKMFCVLLEQIVLNKFNCNNECLLLYYKSLKDNKRHKKNNGNAEKGHFEIIDRNFLHVPEIHELYKFEETFFNKDPYFKRDILLRCSKYKRGELVTNQIFIHFSLDDYCEIEDKKSQYLLSQNRKTKEILHDFFLPFMSSIVFKYVQQCNFCFC